MSEDLFQDHLEEFEAYVEEGAAFTSMAERAIDYKKMDENGLNPDMPEVLTSEKYEARHLIGKLIEKAHDRFEAALQTFEKQTILNNTEDPYNSEKPLEYEIENLHFQDSEKSLNSELLHEEINYFFETVKYAEKNGIEVDEDIVSSEIDGPEIT